MSKILFTILFSCVVFISRGQTNAFTTKDSLNTYCDQVMQTFTEGKFAEGVQLFRRNSVMDTVTINNIGKTMEEQMAALLPFYKKNIGYELIEEKPIKNTLALRRYLLKYENYFLTFDFILYNNGTGWTVSNFNYRDEPKDLF